jgi:hypothetical protein
MYLILCDKAHFTYMSFTARFKTNTQQTGYGSGTVSFTGAGSVTGQASPHTVSAKPGSTTETPPTLPPVTPSKSNGGQTSGSLYEPDYIVSTSKQQLKLLTIPRLLMNFPNYWSATGTMNRNFVLAPEKLKGGYTYMLALKVVDKFKTNQYHRRGMANVLFKVNKNPNIGECSIGPASGYEMETDFGIKCKHGLVEVSTFRC